MVSGGWQFVRTRERGLYAAVVSSCEHHLVASPRSEDDSVEAAGVHLQKFGGRPAGREVEPGHIEDVGWSWPQDFKAVCSDLQKA